MMVYDGVRWWCVVCMVCSGAWCVSEGVRWCVVCGVWCVWCAWCEVVCLMVCDGMRGEWWCMVCVRGCVMVCVRGVFLVARLL